LKSESDGGTSEELILLAPRHFGGFCVVTPRAYNAVLFVSDFIASLNQLQRWIGSRPAYPTGALAPGVARSRECRHSAADRGALRRVGRGPAAGEVLRAALRLEPAADERSAVTASECGAGNTRNAWAQTNIAAVKFRLRACLRIGELSQQIGESDCRPTGKSKPKSKCWPRPGYRQRAPTVMNSLSAAAKSRPIRS
jgi:hypothetical protein